MALFKKEKLSLLVTTMIAFVESNWTPMLEITSSEGDTIAHKYMETVFKERAVVVWEDDEGKVYMNNTLIYTWSTIEIIDPIEEENEIKDIVLKILLKLNEL